MLFSPIVVPAVVIVNTPFSSVLTILVLPLIVTWSVLLPRALPFASLKVPVIVTVSL
jgi:hypothetical protein